MKVINYLICCSVPRGVRKYYCIDSKFSYTVKPPHKMHYETIELPFDCTVVGDYLSVIQDDRKIKVVMDAAKATGRLYNLLTTHSLHPTPATDIIFLIKKQ